VKRWIVWLVRAALAAPPPLGITLFTGPDSNLASVSSNPRDCVKVLILKPSSLGDVVQALPVLRLLKRHRPAAEVHWWLDAGLVPLLEGDPDLAGIRVFRRRRWANPRYWGELFDHVLELRRMRFDCVIDLQSLARSGLIAWLVNAPFTIGLDDAREGARGFYDAVVPRPTYHTHAVDWYLGVLPLLGVPIDRDFHWLPERPDVNVRIREKWGVAGHRYLALQPGARWANKRWPAEAFGELVAAVHRERPAERFVILGSAEDRPLGQEIVAASGDACLDLTGQTTLPEMVEWLRLSALLVTNDTGPMHVAAALGRPVVALFGPTEPRRTGPYGQVDAVFQRAELPCVPCMKDGCSYERPFDCLRGMSWTPVWERVRWLLDHDGS
jgi:heptosyltransferase I